jgi:hypothetical protein
MAGSDDPKDPEIERLKKEKEKATLESEIATKRAELTRVGLPKPDMKPLEGKVVVDEKFSLPSQVLAYYAMDAVLAQVATDIAKAVPNVSTVVMFSEADLAGVATYASTLSQIQTLQKELDRLLPVPTAALPAALLAPEIAGTLIRSTADLVALFRTNVEIKAITVTIDDLAVAAELARFLRTAEPPRAVVYPPLLLPTQFFTGQQFRLVEALNTLLVTWARSVGIVSVFSAKPPGEQAQDPSREKIPQLKALNDRAEKLVASVTAPNDKGISSLTTMLKGELLSAKIVDANSRIIVVKVSASGGADETKQNLFKGTNLLHTGGVAITVMLLDGDGGIAYSKLYWAATEFVKFTADSEWKLRKNF